MTMKAKKVRAQRLPSRRPQEPSLTEPVREVTKFITGGAFDASGGIIRWIGWEEQPYLEGEMRERRIVGRHAMTRRTAREFYHLLGDVLQEEDGRD